MALPPIRRTARALLKIPIVVSGVGIDAPPFKEKTFTVEVNGHGARIVLQNPPRPGDRLTITNIRTQKSCPFLVVGVAREGTGGEPEYGVESLQPEENIWGIYFPGKTPVHPPVKEKLIDALLECQRCGFQEMAQLTFDQFRILGAQPFLKRRCIKCGEVTEWGYGYVEEEVVPPVSPQPPSSAPPPPGGIERRKSKRVVVKLPVRIRLDDGREDIARTENLSKTGVRFISELKMNVGDTFRITVGYSGPGSGEEIAAKVVNWQELGGTGRAIYRAVYGVRVEEVGRAVPA
jgi:hypothetical protein